VSPSPARDKEDKEEVEEDEEEEEEEKEEGNRSSTGGTQTPDWTPEEETLTSPMSIFDNYKW
jgi:hypothetical protein